MSSQNPGYNPTGYLGTNFTSPGQNWFRKRDPLPSDFRNYSLGDRWIRLFPISPGAASIWALVAKDATSGTWAPLGGGSVAIKSLTPDTGAPVVPTSGDVVVTGDPTQGISTLNSGVSILGITIADAAAAQKGVVSVNSVVHGVLFGGATQEVINSSSSGSSGQVLVSSGATADPNWTSDVTVDTTGIISMPSQSAMSAYVSGNIANVTGDLVSIYTVLFDSKDYDVQTEYTPGTGIFKATLAGLYQVSSVVGISNIGAAHTVANIAINKNGSVWWQAQYNPAASQDAANQLSMMANAVLELAPNDEITITIQVGGGTKTIGIIGATNVHTELQITKLA